MKRILKQSIHTINTRDGILNFLSNYKEVDDKDLQLGICFDDVVKEVEKDFDIMVDSLTQQGLEYGDFRNSLVPHRKNREYIFLFDRFTIKETYYGGVVLKEVLGKLGNQISTAITVGDILEEEEIKLCYILNVLQNNFNFSCKVNKLDKKRIYYMVYLNNITENCAKELHEKLSLLDYYTGYKSIYNDNILKNYLFVNYANSMLKIKNNILMSQPFDCMEEDKVIEKGNFQSLYPLTNINYFNVSDRYYEPFLVFTPAVELGGIDDMRNIKISNKILFDKKNVNVEIYISQEAYNYLTVESNHNIDLDKEEIKKIVENKVRNLDFYELKKEVSNDSVNSLYYSFVIIFGYKNKRYKCVIHNKKNCFEICTMYELQK